LPRPSHVPPAPPRSALPRPAHGPGDAGRAAGLEEGAARLAWASRRGSTARGRPAWWGPRDLGEVHAAQKLTPVGVRIKGEVAAAARDPGTLAERAKALALETGFDVVGIAAADAPPELSFFAEWLGRGYAGEMAYLTSQARKRSDLRAAFPWARSVI